MQIPKVILKVGDTVEFKSPFKGYNNNIELIEYSGVITKVNKNDCKHKSTLRDLTYDIKSTCNDREFFNVRHEYVNETILCSECGSDILEYGVEEKIFKIYRYNKSTMSGFEEYTPSFDNCYQCSCCGSSITHEEHLKLRKYLNII